MVCRHLAHLVPARGAPTLWNLPIILHCGVGNSASFLRQNGRLQPTYGRLRISLLESSFSTTAARLRASPPYSYLRHFLEKERNCGATKIRNRKGVNTQTHQPKRKKHRTHTKHPKRSRRPTHRRTTRAPTRAPTRKTKMPQQFHGTKILKVVFSSSLSTSLLQLLLPFYHEPSTDVRLRIPSHNCRIPDSPPPFATAQPRLTAASSAVAQAASSSVLLRVFHHNSCLLDSPHKRHAFWRKKRTAVPHFPYQSPTTKLCLLIMTNEEVGVKNISRKNHTRRQLRHTPQKSPTRSHQEFPQLSESST